MSIVFFCQSCGARFEVDPRMAGKKGRCKKCGQQMAIPRAEQIASMSAMPALVLAGAGMLAAGRPAAAASNGPSIGAMLKAGISQVGLAPLSLERIPIRPKLASALDDAEDSKPYVLAQPMREQRGKARVQDNFLLRTWRNQLGNIQKIFRKINQAAYLISVPFLMILILGAAVKNRQIAIFGATFVVLINIVRLASGAANLAIIPFRDGINPGKMKKPVRRVIEPAITIVLVVIAFTFIPWLSVSQAAKGSIADRIRSGAGELRQEIKGEVSQVVDVEKLGNQAREKLKELGDKAGALNVQAREKLKELGSPSSGSPTEPSQAGPGSP